MFFLVTMTEQYLVMNTHQDIPEYKIAVVCDQDGKPGVGVFWE